MVCPQDAPHKVLREKSRGEGDSTAEEGTFPDSTEYFPFAS